ncbi:MAG: SAM-dependent methyltransferase [Chitinophagia bacterium]|nr:SAM-dependent methyltransferase [Chitinophagia bacterium]
MKEALGKVLLLPMLLHEEGWEAIPKEIDQWIKSCDVFFVENEKTTRRYFKKIWKEMVIDNYQWFTIHQVEEAQINNFIQILKSGKTIGIVSEAGCAGIADPGQLLVSAAQQLGATVKPYMGPSSILLSLMASGFNGQGFTFNGYLPIDTSERKKKIQQLEQIVTSNGIAQLFIETPYRNNQLLEALIQSCHPTTQLCIGVDITGPTESIKTATIQYWKNNKPELHKKLAIFILGK